MAGHRPWSELVSKMSPERRAESKRLHLEDCAQMLKSMLGHLVGLPHEQMAKLLEVPLEELIDVEYQEDMTVNEIRRLIEELDADIEIRFRVGERSCRVRGESGRKMEVEVEPVREHAA